MDDANLNRAITVLERHANVGLPIIILHAAMHRAGAANLTLAALDRGLRDRGDLFAVIEPAPLPWDTGLWPPGAVSTYREALHHVGFAAETFVVLRPHATTPQGLITRLRATLIALREGQPEQTTAVARALLAANAVSASWRRPNRRRDETTRPTILLPDHRPPAPGRQRALRRRRRRLPSP
jgi:hypothetical protein